MTTSTQATSQLATLENLRDINHRELDNQLAQLAELKRAIGVTKDKLGDIHRTLANPNREVTVTAIATIAGKKYVVATHTITALEAFFEDDSVPLEVSFKMA